MTNHQLRLLERDDQVRIRGSRTLYKVAEKAEIGPRTESGKTSSVVKIIAYHRHDGTQPFEVNGKLLVHPELKGRPYVQKWPKIGKKKAS